MQNFLLLLAGFALDRISKIFIMQNKLIFLSENAFLPFIMHIKYVENKGVAFSMFSSSILATIILPTILIIIFGYFILSLKQKPLHVAYVILLSGYLGNIYDRVFYGYVVDMIYFPLFPYFVCNIADILIFTSTLFIAYYVLKKGDLYFGK